MRRFLLRLINVFRAGPAEGVRRCLRLEQNGWIKGSWRKSENNRDAKYYAVTGPGVRALEQETERWKRFAGLVDKLLVDEG